MRKYNRILAVFISLYLLLALGTGMVLYRMQGERDREFKVEINRICHEISVGTHPGQVDLGRYRDVYGIEVLTLDEAESRESVEMFFKDVNDGNVVVKPWIADGSLKGYLRFLYREEYMSLDGVMMTVQAALALMAVSVTGVLLYLKYRVIKPFNRVSELPYELAKGHLKGEVKQEKNRYFGNFLWGIGQLKDTLEVTKKRRLELEREKKKMLLSLSHDMKTPLGTIKLYGKALEQGLYDTEEKKRHAARQIGVKAEEIEGYVAEIVRNSKEDILDIRVEMGEFYLEELVRRVADTYVEKCAVRMVELVIGKYENRIVRGNLDRALEVIDNVMENAFKYGDGRRIEFSFYEEDYCQLIRIFNTGKAVSENDLNHIFESFFRGTNSMGQQGSGLGLYICREIMRKMDGEVFAERDKDGMGIVMVFR
ncbi:HAMP domain-containing histidine kinase [Blautia coccoides]|uniref:histidine kinase n=2 Tax=Blautia producta TaxID=33035 RepID=A0A7G5MZ86_9FIRM|nr:MULTISPECIES: HAMP domain-containing sensor histidine kinase [Blautia]MCR1985975.1 HAMP domain-containing histidine kinase [Blautia coccoides]MDU5220509.1 HAMP domain-containing sensor histidine kinase [Blautia producta]MDU5382366.1 HAMP domain-containing sensor histidine kinase [Blautia producta]MDU6883620.1 HAMP domain-containing sensor histidine kinase [Blautia producta]QIB57293.1 HAMP domain-containing histidine kinase [Blautia producta ATCC 27340 = DSM 2950]